ncbi:MAG: hypothetical protein ACTSWI_02355 [Alphaproteobacteria bacterium]
MIFGSEGRISAPRRLFIAAGVIAALAAPSFAQDTRAIPATQVPASLYCGHFPVTIYTQNAGNPRSQFRAADYNVQEVGQRYFIDPGIDGAIEAAWYAPSASLVDMALIQKITVSPAPNDNRLVVLDVLAVPDVAPGHVDVTIHIACRPGSG